MSKPKTEEQKQRQRDLYRAWVAANKDKVRANSKRAKERAKMRDPEEWRRKESARGKAYYAKNRDKQRLNNHRANLKRHYGITPEDYQVMLLAQGGKCALCSRGPDASLHQRLYVDHDHETRVIRGLLCYRCNASLGQFGDNLPGIQKVVDYLLRAEIYGRKIA